MFLAKNYIQPPEKWIHNKFLRDIDGRTVQDYLEINCIDVPEQWKYNEQIIELLDQICIQNDICNTNVIVNNPEKQLQPEKQTFAIFLASEGILPPKEFTHDPLIKNQNNQTVAMLLAMKNLQIESQWQHNPIIRDIDGNTVAMLYAYQGIKAQQFWFHNVELQNDQGLTLAMIFAQKGIIPHVIYNHKNTLVSKQLNTVAMYLAYQGIIPPKCWQHDSVLKNKQQQTVGIILASKGIIPPKEWITDINIKDKYGNSIKSNLLKFNYIYQDNNFKLNAKLQLINQKCDLCLNECQQEIIISKCNHNICINCFKMLIQAKQILKCPICNKENWFNIISDQQFVQYINFIEQTKQQNSNNQYDLDQFIKENNIQVDDYNFFDIF